MIVLSIIIPTYNRPESLLFCLKFIARAIVDYEDQVEVLVIDNNSDYSFKKDVLSRLEKPIKNFNYIKNSKNIGFQNIKVALNSGSGDYKWIIGDDDFIHYDSIEKILDFIKIKKPDYLVLNYNNFIHKDSSWNIEMYNKISLNQKKYFSHVNKLGNMEFKSLGNLISPKFKNAYLGSVMVSIFKKDLYSGTYYINQKIEEFYPHINFIASNLSKSINTQYLSEPLILVGHGLREWAGEDKKDPNSIWNSDLPYILYEVQPEVINFYLKNGLDKLNYFKCQSSIALSIGILTPQLIYRKIMKKPIKNNRKIHIIGGKFKLILYPTLYWGFYKGIKEVVKDIIY